MVHQENTCPLFEQGIEQENSAAAVATEQGDNPATYAGSSVLATGQWVKIAVTQTGVHKIDMSLLQQMGFDAATIDPRNLAIFGNGGGNKTVRKIVTF